MGSGQAQLGPSFITHPPNPLPGGGFANHEQKLGEGVFRHKFSIV